MPHRPDAHRRAIRQHPPASPPNAGVKSWLKRPVGWSTATFGLLVVAIATAFGTGVGQELVTPALTSIGLKKKPAMLTVSTEVAYKELALKDSVRSGPSADALLLGLPTAEEQESFIQKAHAMPVDTGTGSDAVTLKLTFATSSENPIRITNITVQKSVEKLYSGTLVIMPSQGGGEPNIPVTLNLDRPAPVFRGSDQRPYFGALSIPVKKDDQATLSISCRARKAAYRWSIAVTYSNSSGKHTTYLGRTGRQYTNAKAVPLTDQFALTASSPKYETTYEPNYPGTGFHLK
jgi:hypothetical protein